MRALVFFTFVFAFIVRSIQSVHGADADLSQADVLWNFADLSDSNGANSALTLAGVNAPTVNNVGVVPGPGSDNLFASFPGDQGDLTSTNGGYLKADPGDGAAGELELTNPAGFTILSRVRFTSLFAPGTTTVHY